MHQLARYCAGWVSATALATGVSWVAIDNLVTTAALSQPLAAPARSQAAVTPSTPSVVTPTASPSAGPFSSKQPKSPAVISPSRSSSSPSSRKRVGTPTEPPQTAAAPDASAQGYTMKGGQVVLDLRPDSATLVSAVPAEGYKTEQWTTEYWLRVDFVKGDRRSSLIVSWYQHAPTVDQTET
jgi:hypothetical protein